ncbi:MAG: DUF1508 domain-containing protein [Ruminococcaceae bacterium]|jgi:hypothetical protein|nr:DUF1508 domain-containing protein [Oscillospiraceae bacterium]
MAKFIVKQTPTGFKFDLRDENGVLATSEVYASEAACKKGVDSVKNSAGGEVENQTVEGFETKKHPKYEVYEDKAGGFRYRLKARNGEIVAIASASFKTVDEVLAAVETVRAEAAEAKVDTVLAE